jgi:hypothetical protein
VHSNIKLPKLFTYFCTHLVLDSVKNEGSKLIQVVHSPKEIKFYSFKAIRHGDMLIKKKFTSLEAKPQVPTL